VHVKSIRDHIRAIGVDHLVVSVYGPFERPSARKTVIW
jgi:hypothetical protein